MERFAGFVLKFRWLITVMVVAVTVIFGTFIPSVQINSDVVQSLPDTDKHAALLKQVGAEFGGNKTGMIIVETDNIFTAEAIEHVKMITDTLTYLEGISSVTGLTTVMHINSNEDGLEIGKLVDEGDMPETPGELALLRERVMADDNVRGNLVSEDGTSSIIVFTISDDVNMQSLAGLVKQKTEALELPEKIYYAGSPMMLASISHLIASDLTRLLPVAFVLIALVLYLGFRSLRGVVLPLLIAIISIIWVIGIMSLTGAEMTMVSNNIPIVLLAVGTAYTIHVLNRIDQVKGDTGKAIISALTYVTIPVILAALTTIGGFLSFIFGSYLTMIRDFGIYTALGTFIALFLSLVFVPALVSALRWDKPEKDPEPPGQGNTFFSRNLHTPLHSLLFNRTKAVFAAWIAITVISTGGIFLIERNVDVRNYFRKHNETRIAEDIMTAKFGGSKPVFVQFRGDIQSPEVLSTMLRAEEYMKKNPGVASTQSVASLLAGLYAALGEGDSLPDDKDKIQQLWFLLEGNESISSFVNDDLSGAIIISKFLSPENRERIEFERYMDKFIEENSSPECEISMTGMPFIEVAMDRSLVKSQIGSLIMAVVFVILVVSLVLRSFISGFFAAVPVVATILILFGVMGFSGIPLNIATVLVASFAMGTGIDYSIHVITHFNSHMRENAGVSEALDETIRVSGKAIIINVVSVSAGFLVLLFSEMVPLQYFGLLISLSMVGSGLSALTFLPAILIIANRKRKSYPGN